MNYVNTVNVLLHFRTAILQEDVVIGSNSKIGKDTNIKQSVIGNNCSIGWYGTVLIKVVIMLIHEIIYLERWLSSLYRCNPYYILI